MAVGKPLGKKDRSINIKVMSFNVRYGKAKDGDNSWDFRKAAAAEMVNDQAPAVFGVQEALPFQLDYLKENCKNYLWVGVGRDDGESAGEHMSVFYDTTRVSLLKWGTYWLSETPEVPSKGWDAACRRTATWTLLKDRLSGREFFFVNTHLDHRGVEARRRGLILLVERIADMNPDGFPMILCGDFNIYPDNPGLEGLNALMSDARETAAVTDREETFHGFGKVSGRQPIDYIYWKGFASCEEFARVTREYAGAPYVSDHYPVTAVFTF